MKRLILLSSLISCSVAHTAAAADSISVEIKGGQFNPSVIEVPRNQKIQLSVKNNESEEVEFESYELNREVKIKPGKTSSIFIGPLAAGSYPVFDDNNPNAKCTVVVR